MKMHARKTGWLVERTERILSVYLRRKEEGRGVFVRPTYFPPRPSCPLQRIPFLPTADWLSSLLFALPSLHGFVADVWALEREKMAYLGRFQRPDAATSPKGIINRARPPARGFAFFFTLFFFLSFYSSIRFRKKWINPASYSGFVEREREYRFPIRVG